MVELVEKVIASTFEKKGTVQILCGQCGKKHYVANECVEQNGKINAESLFGAYLSSEKFLYCDQKCWSDYCSD